MTATTSASSQFLRAKNAVFFTCTEDLIKRITDQHDTLRHMPTAFISEIYGLADLD